MRLFELLDSPLPYKLMQTKTNANEGSKEHTFGFRVGDYLYKVYIDLYPMRELMDEEDAHGEELEGRLPQDFIEAAEHHMLIMSVDFGQFDYEERVIPIKGKVPWGAGEERIGREGTGNELQVFSTVAAIATDMFNTYEKSIGAIEYGYKKEDPKRGRLYDRLMRKFGVQGTRFRWDVNYAEDGTMSDRIIIVV